MSLLHVLLDSCTEVAVCTASVCQNSIVLEDGIATIQNLGATYYVAVISRRCKIGHISEMFRILERSLKFRDKSFHFCAKRWLNCIQG